MKKNFRKEFRKCGCKGAKDYNYKEKRNYNKLVNTRGITLIALVITIIILLILARRIVKHGI